MDDLIRVGVIASTHGIKGEVKVFPTTDDVTRFKKLKKVLISNGNENLEIEIESVKFFKQLVIVKFKGIDDINDVEKHKGKDILINRENAVKLEKNEHFIYEIIGSKVVTDEGFDLGELTEVLTTGANDVYVITTKEKKEILLPSIEQCILDVNVENKLITVHIMDGLLD